MTHCHLIGHAWKKPPAWLGMTLRSKSQKKDSISVRYIDSVVLAMAATDVLTLLPCLFFGGEDI